MTGFRRFRRFCRFRRFGWGPAAAVLLLGAALGAGAAAAREATPSFHRQQQDIDAMIRELDYLIEHAERLAARYRRDDAPIRFNYGAFLEQLRLTRARSAAYLNEAHEAVLHAPPPPDGVSLTQRR